jgi:hypothetical protein
LKTALIITGIIAVLWLLDRGALAMERRGWIYWRKRKASPGTRAAAFLEMQSLLEPGRNHVIEAQSEHEEKKSDAAGPPSSKQQAASDEQSTTSGAAGGGLG